MTFIAKLGSAGAVGVLLSFATGAEPALAQDASDMLQIESVQGGVAIVLQQGTGHQATIDQKAVASGAVDLQNHGLISQTGHDNSAAILQEGSSNNAAITQDGARDQGSIYQQNSGNNFLLQQSGNGLSATIQQFGQGAPGAPPISITQTK